MLKNAKSNGHRKPQRVEPDGPDRKFTPLAGEASGARAREEYIRGWWGCFQLAEWRRAVTDLSGWIRRHMRQCFWLRWHHPRGRLSALRRLGVQGRELGMAYHPRGAWAMARHWVENKALGNRTLQRYGFTRPWDTATP